MTAVRNTKRDGQRMGWTAPVLFRPVNLNIYVRRLNLWIGKSTPAVITDRLMVGDVEFVIGQCDKAPANFVTWKRRKGEKEYFWGHYMSNRLMALEDLCNRALDEIHYVKNFQCEQNPAEEPVKQVRKKKREPER